MFIQIKMRKVFINLNPFSKYMFEKSGVKKDLSYSKIYKNLNMSFIKKIYGN